ncbi:type I polyketide synthase [Ralstonia solanacearum]|uniref:type I polyketide synthase n=1 Tax=Ralstonia solanacearum TaxID=305 RepID=UPI0001D967DD|nr:type I polyketide synthase [Ralstonia solanacearum]CBJ34757.1 RhiF polyketide synthase, rhizoxin biosynthesis [Ralstonia solanacearum PSI07]
MKTATASNTSDISLPNQRRGGQRQAVPQRARRQIGDDAERAAGSQPQAGKVAIVGFSGRFPGADTPQAFWRLLVEGRSAVGAFPYWDLPGIAERRHLRDAFACPGGFILDPAAFDADFFKISAREAEAMDPQHRLVLEQTWAAFEDAGICPRSLRGSNTGVYIGVSSADYNGLLARSAAGAHDATGNAHSIIANRISYLFDFHGPSAPIDTACSSSLVAVHRAAQSILSGDCTVAVAGGVNLCFEPMVFIGAAKAGMLSPGGHCRTFAADADGYVRGEGVGVLILKDYRQALADGDNIVATVIGSAENHGGHANSLTAPNPRAQADLIKQACRGIDIDSIGYIEAHGTGTRLGDPIEISGLKQAFAELGGSGARRCYLGSVKTNIGHLESAAGIAGVIKVLLALKHGYLPKSLHSEPLNPYIDLAGSPFEVLGEGRAWPQQPDSRGGMLPRRAGVSSFGFGGANAHVVLEAAEPAAGAAVQGWAATIFPLSARTPEALRARVEQLIDCIERQPGLALPDLAASLQLGREAMECRLAIAAESRDGLLARLRHDPVGVDGDGQGSEPADDIAASEVFRALQQQDRDALLALWRRGANVDWRQLYPAGRARRIPLPTYPFSRDVYWISDTPAAGRTREPVLHPLVQRNTSDLAGQRFSSRFDGNESFFDEHRIRGRKILPGVAYLEMARAAIALSLAGDEAPVRLKHIAWQQPMRHDGGELAIDIELAEQGNGEIRFEVLGAAAQGPSYCRGVALVGAAEPLPQLDLPAIAAATAVQRLESRQCYRIFGEMGLDYGDRFRGIRALQAGNGQVLATLALPGGPADTGDCTEPLRMPPGLLDSALQSALGLALLDPAQPDDGRQPLVPFALDGVIFGDLSLLGDGCHAWVRYAANHQPGRITRLDVDLCDTQGRVALRLLGFSSRRLDGGRAEPLVMMPLWRDRAPRLNGAQRCSRHRILLLDHPHIAPDALAERCRDLAADGRQIHIERLPVVADDPAPALQALAAFLLRYLKACRAEDLVQLILPDCEAGLQPMAPVFASLQALLRTARNERLIGVAQSIEVAGVQSPEQLAQWLIESSRQADERVRYQDGPGGRPRRQVASWHETALAAAARAPWRAGGVYLLTGGAGGLGLLLAEAIAREARGAKLILAGRSAGQPPETSARRIAEIEALGAEVRLEALDVADQAAVDALIARCERAFGGIHGVVHCAGLTRDSLLAQKTEADLAAVLAPKVAGTLNLDRATAHLALDCFVLFSSASAVMGNPGQGDYALANAFMDAFAGWRNRQAAAGRRHGRTLAVNWPLWRNGGMRIDPRHEQRMAEQTGIRPLSDHGGLELLRRALADASAPGQLMVLEGDTARIQAFVAEQWHEPVAMMFDAPEAADPPAASTAQAPAEALPPAASASAPADGDPTNPAIRYFKQLLSQALKRPAEKIDSDGTFERYGVDSIILTELTAKLEQHFGSLPSTLLYEYQTVRELSGYFADHHREALQRLVCGEPANRRTAADNADVGKRAAAAPSPQRHRRNRTSQRGIPSVASQSRDLAIIGLSGRYPGAEDLETFWRRLAGGEDLVSEVPAQRWDHQAYFDEQRGRFDKTYCKWGGFLDGVEDFDPLFFNLSPREAAIVNPNDRLFLETCWNLLEGAGLTRQRLRQQYRQQVGVFVGVMYQQYQAFQADLVRESLVSVASYSAIANRVSYFFDFQGPSLAIDTMCSSSISAIHAAGEALRNGDCRLAIAGGVNLTLHPKKYIGLSVGQVLGSRAGSRSFADGDGYLPAEGVGAVLLKTLADAERDGDPILAVIKSTAVNHGGHTHGFSVPSAKAQAELIGSHFKRAGIDPRTISYVESAANGSAMGDAIELSALSRVFSEAGVAGRSCAIGSVKSNIGHAEAASGMSQLSKLVLQLQHRQLAPSLLLGPLNPKLDFDNSPFVLQRELGDWAQPVVEMDGVSQPCPRRASLSAFGAGGSNAHLILEEYPRHEERPARPAADAAQVEDGVLYIVPMSAKSAGSLHGGVARLARHLDTHPDLRLNDLAYTLQTGREAMEWRLALLAKGMGELRTALAAILRVLDQGEGMAALETLDLPLFFGNVDEVPAAMASLLSGPGADALSRSLIAAGEREQLALFWTQGGEVPWDTLAENTSTGHGVGIVPLPTYAFDKQRYWLEPPNTLKALRGDVTAASTTSTTQPLPERMPANVTDAQANSEETAAEQGLRLLAGLLGMAPKALSPAKPLSVYGADSIVMAQLAMRLQAEVDPGFTLAEIQQCVTIRDLRECLAERGRHAGSKGQGQGQALPAEISKLFTRPAARFLELQRLNTMDHGRPVFWIHGALGGCEIYQGLAQRIKRPFFGLQARGWMTSRHPLQGIQAMAAYYVQAIQSVQSHGPYDLGGYSLGGMLAYEVTRQLQELGETVTTLVMLDSPDVTGERTARLADKTRLLQTVNMALQMTIGETPERFAEVLIHRDAIDLSLSQREYLQQLTALARQRGLKMSDDRLQQLMEQVAQIQQAYHVEHHRILPLPRAGEVACHYFRNAGGLWMGALEPYFSTDGREFAAFNHANYWQEWQRQLPNFEMIDVASSSHMTLLTEPEVFEVIATFCASLYAEAVAEDTVG